MLLKCPRKVMSSMEDKLFLKEAKGDQFSVKLVYQSLNGYAVNPFPFRTIWNSLVPSKVGFFAWRHLGAKSLLWISLKDGAEF